MRDCKISSNEMEYHKAKRNFHLVRTGKKEDIVHFKSRKNNKINQGFNDCVMKLKIRETHTPNNIVVRIQNEYKLQ